MWFSEQLRFILVLAPILSLLLVGFFISLQSGDASLRNARGLLRFLGNLSRLLLRLFGYLAGLLAVQQLVGLPVNLYW